MIVWRDRETGPAYPSIGSAPSIATFGMSWSVTTFMTTLSSRFNVFKVSDTRDCITLRFRDAGTFLVPVGTAAARLRARLLARYARHGRAQDAKRGPVRLAMAPSYKPAGVYHP